MHNARNCGNQKFISAGASVPGVSWNSISTPSTVSVWPVSVIVSVGWMSEIVPSEFVFPSPASTWPRGPRSRVAPYMYWARLLIATPAKTFSLTAASTMPTGAMTRQRPESTSSWVVTPLTPPKWSTWLWV